MCHKLSLLPQLGAAFAMLDIRRAHGRARPQSGSGVAWAITSFVLLRRWWLRDVRSRLERRVRCPTASLSLGLASTQGTEGRYRNEQLCWLKRLRASSRDGGGGVNGPPSPRTMLLSRRTRRREVIALLGGGAIFGPRTGIAQPTGPVRRIGLLSPQSVSSAAPLLAGLRQGLRDLGWIEGRNIVFELRYADGRIDHLPGLAAELVRQNVEVIVAGSNAGALAAKQATGTIPIVMATTGNPIAGGLAETLARPGANVTGVTSSVGPRGAEPRRRRGPVRWRGGRERPATGQLYPSERGACGQAPSCQRHSRTRRAKPPFDGTLCGLAVDDRRSRARFAACVLPHLNIERVVDALQRPVPVPQVKVLPDGAARRQVLRQPLPLTPRPEHIKDRVEDLTNVHCSRAAAALGRTDQRSHQRPFGLRQITLVTQAAPVGGRSMFRLPHGGTSESGAVQGITSDSRDSSSFRNGSEIRHSGAAIGDRQLPICAMDFVADDHMTVDGALRERVFQGIDHQLGHDEADADRLVGGRGPIVSHNLD